MKAYLKIIVLASIFMALSGCVIFHGYRPEVIQGNELTLKQVQQVKVGMDRNQVLAILGTPILTNTFSHQRWNYVYTYQKVGHAFHERYVIVYFDHNKVTQLKLKFG